MPAVNGFRKGVPVRAAGGAAEVPLIQGHFSADEVDQALCSQIGGENWFPEKGEQNLAREAIKICNNCPIRVRCLQIALDRDERYGVWGGLTERQRRRLKRGK